jgi:murein L,D-transpeptidase YcbB/YkuD
MRYWRFDYWFAWLLLAGIAGIGVLDRSPADRNGTTQESLQLSPPREPTGQWRILLNSFIQAGNLPELRWPDFGNYRDDLTNFYEDSGFGLAWVKYGRITPQARGVIAAIQNAAGRGLNDEDYDGPRWDARVAMLESANPAPSPADAARFDLSLTVCLMRFISDLHIGRINPRILHAGFNIGPSRYDLAHFVLHRIVGAKDVEVELDAAEPPYPGYRLARRALARYLRLAREYSGEPLPEPAAALRRGDQYPGMERLTGLLRLLGDLPADADIPAGNMIYTGDVEEAVRRFQMRHGLDPDGCLGKATLGQLNIPLSRRVQQLVLTLERWRWIPHEFSHPPIIVNIPEFQLQAMGADGKPALTMKVVVGKAFHSETPVFAEEMKYIVFRPYWNVPTSIQRRELVPQIRKDRDYLLKNAYEVTNRSGQVLSEGTVNDEILEGLRRGEFSIRQRPGPKNSLGLIKFMLPNEFDIYLHGTSAPGLFSRYRRDFSHGCIRVEKPESLAVWALAGNPAWPGERIQAAMQGPDPVQVNLENPIPVLILYTTAVAQEDGTVKFLQDIYGYDDAMEQILDRGYPYGH